MLTGIPELFILVCYKLHEKILHTSFLSTVESPVVIKDAERADRKFN
jgi:hypothetical protein